MGSSNFNLMYECLSCGYSYVPDDGSPASGVSPGTPFDELPDGFVCPACGADLERFVSIAGREADSQPGDGYE
jgi:rubredoxin